MIWLVHLHKAGGSSIVSLAEDNGEQLDPGSVNANPVDHEGHQIDFGSMDRQALEAFVTKRITCGVSFVASEFSTPDLTALAADPRVILVCTIRDPMARYVSNYNFDYYQGYNHARSLAAYPAGSTRSICRDNYYCNALLGRHFDPPPLTDADVEAALEALALIDVVIVLERPESFDALSRLGWTEKHKAKNKFEPGWRGVMAARRSPGLMWRRLRFRKASFDTAEAEAFRSRNAADYLFYETALARTSHCVGAGPL